MSLLYAGMRPQGVTMLGEAARLQPDWVRDRSQDPPGKAVFHAQQQRSPPSRSGAVGKSDDAGMEIPGRITIRLSRAEPPKMQGWPKPHAATVQGSEVRVLIVEAKAGLAHGRNYGGGWPTATTPTSDQETLADTLRELLHSANYEVFEDGMDSDFSNNLNRIIRNHGIAAVDALEGEMYADSVSPEVAAEALIWVGRMDDRATRHARLAVLERALEAPNVCIRDAASIGIGAMDDPTAMDSLQKAADRERCGLLRQNLKDTLEQLKDAR